MWSVHPPSLEAADTYPMCVSGVDSSLLRTRLEAAEATAISKERRLVQAIQTSTVHQLLEHDFRAPPASSGDLTGLYEHQMVAPNGSGREVYDAILLSAEFCHACQHSIPDSVDHYLPKSRFPALSVAPANLTPMCRRCNGKKSTAVARTEERVFVHPYFEDFESLTWLAADVEETPHPHVRFRVADSELPTVTAARVRNHMDRYHLHELYGVLAARKARSSRKVLEVLWEAGGSIAVEDRTLENADSCRDYQLNSWETATWTAFGQSEWFCDGGFAQFGI